MNTPGSAQPVTQAAALAAEAADAQTARAPRQEPGGWITFLMKPEYRPHHPRRVPAAWPGTRLHSRTIMNPASAPNGKSLGTLQGTGLSPVLMAERGRPSRLPGWLASLQGISGGISFPAPRKRERNAAMLSFFHKPLLGLLPYNKMTHVTSFILNYGHCGKDTGFSPHW